jgi:predicted transposase YbfD/YdcC
VDGKSLRGTRHASANGQATHLLAVCDQQAGAVLGQAAVDGKTNEISAFAPLLEPLGLAGCVVTADAMHSQRDHAEFLVTRNSADYILIVKKNQPSLYAQLKKLPWRHIGAGDRQHARGHGRDEYRTIKTATVAAGLAFPHAAQAIAITRRVRPLGESKWRTATVYGITSLTVTQATPADLNRWIRGHWRIEALHHIRSPGVRRVSRDVAPDALRRAFATHLRGCRARCRCWSDARRVRTGCLAQHLWRDYPILINRWSAGMARMSGSSRSRPPKKLRGVTFGEDASQARTGSGPQVMATVRNATIGIMKTGGHSNIAAATRYHARDATRTLATLGLSPA